MSEHLRALKRAVQDEERRLAGIEVGRVEAVSDDGAATVNIGSQAANATNVRPSSTARVSPTDTGYLVQLDGHQAPIYWQRASIACGGADPPIISV